MKDQHSPSTIVFKNNDNSQRGIQTQEDKDSTSKFDNDFMVDVFFEATKRCETLKGLADIEY